MPNMLLGPDNELKHNKLMFSPPRKRTYLGPHYFNTIRYETRNLLTPGALFINQTP